MAGGNDGNTANGLNDDSKKRARVDDDDDDTAPPPAKRSQTDTDQALGQMAYYLPQMIYSALGNTFQRRLQQVWSSPLDPTPWSFKSPLQHNDVDMAIAAVWASLRQHKQRNHIMFGNRATFDYKRPKNWTAPAADVFMLSLWVPYDVPSTIARPNLKGEYVLMLAAPAAQTGPAVHMTFLYNKRLTEYWTDPRSRERITRAAIRLEAITALRKSQWCPYGLSTPTFDRKNESWPKLALPLPWKAQFNTGDSAAYCVWNAWAYLCDIPIDDKRPGPTIYPDHGIYTALGLRLRRASSGRLKFSDISLVMRSVGYGRHVKTAVPFYMLPASERQYIAQLQSIVMNPSTLERYLLATESSQQTSPLNKASPTTQPATPSPPAPPPAPPLVGPLRTPSPPLRPIPSPPLRPIPTPPKIPARKTSPQIPTPKTPSKVPTPKTPAAAPPPKTPPQGPSPQTPTKRPAPNTPSKTPAPKRSRPALRTPSPLAAPQTPPTAPAPTTPPKAPRKKPAAAKTPSPASDTQTPPPVTPTWDQILANRLVEYAAQIADPTYQINPSPIPITSEGNWLLDSEVCCAIASLWLPLLQDPGARPCAFGTTDTFTVYSAQTVADAGFPDAPAIEGPHPLLMPLNSSQSHFTLAIAAPNQQNGQLVHVTHYDSGKASKRAIRADAESIATRSGWLDLNLDTGTPNTPLPTLTFTHAHPGSPRQSDSWSCGPYAILNAWCYLLDLPIASNLRLGVPRSVTATRAFARQLHDLVEHAVAGRLHSDTIQAFVNVYKYVAVDQDVADPVLRVPMVKCRPMNENQLQTMVEDMIGNLQVAALF